MPKQSRPCCPVCYFPTDVVATLKVQVPVEWSKGKSNVALICSNCQTCILTDERNKDGGQLPLIDCETDVTCPCVGEQGSACVLILDRTQVDAMYGTLKSKCSVCGVERLFDLGLQAEEDDQETSAAESPESQGTKSANAMHKVIAVTKQDMLQVFSAKPSMIEVTPNDAKEETVSKKHSKNKKSPGSSETNKETSASSMWYVDPDNEVSAISEVSATNKLLSANSAVTATKYTEQNTESDDNVSMQNKLNSETETNVAKHHEATPEKENSDSKPHPLYATIERLWLKSLSDNGQIPDACPHCSDPDKQQSYFNEGGFVTHVLCTECGARTNWTVGDGKTTPKTLVSELKMLKPGDHVAWHRPCGIWHHAIVFDTKPKRAKIEVVHYNGSVVKFHGAFASVRREWLLVDVEEENFYRIDYLPGESHPPEIVMERALQRLYEAAYNPFTHNCEHFARWCKTGHERCVQIERIPRRVLKAADRVALTTSKTQWCKNAVATLPDDVVEDVSRYVAGAGLYLTEKTDLLTTTLGNKLSLLSGTMRKLKQHVASAE